MNEGNQYSIASHGYGTAMDSTSERMSDHDSLPEKRQRLNQGNYG